MAHFSLFVNYLKYIIVITWYLIFRCVHNATNQNLSLACKQNILEVNNYIKYICHLSVFQKLA